jgi:hypothetical protein
MKIKIRPDDTSMVQDDDWLQMDGWLAGLRDGGRADPAGDRHAQPARGSDPWPEVLADRDPGRAVGGYLPVGLLEPGWHR